MKVLYRLHKKSADYTGVSAIVEYEGHGVCGMEFSRPSKAKHNREMFMRNITCACDWCYLTNMCNLDMTCRNYTTSVMATACIDTLTEEEHYYEMLARDEQAVLKAELRTVEQRLQAEPGLFAPRPLESRESCIQHIKGIEKPVMTYYADLQWED